MELVSDLSLLENAARYSIEKEAKPIKFEQKKSFQKPQAFQALQRACWRRNRCRLLGLPHHFSRHRENTSTHQTSNDNIYWRITWMLPHHTKHVIYSERISERLRLGDLVKDMLTKIIEDLSEDDISIYKSTQLKDFDILLKSEYMQMYSKNNLRYTELDIEKSLVWNLQEQTIVENPTIAIVHKHHSDFFIEDKDEKIVDVSQITDNKITDEPSIFVGLNFHGDSGEEQIQPDPVPVQPEAKKLQNVNDMVPMQVSTSQSSENSQIKPISDSGAKVSKPNVGLVSLVSYASSEEEEI